MQKVLINVLIIENNHARKEKANETFGSDPDFQVTFASSYEEAYKLIDGGSPRFHILVDGINESAHEWGLGVICIDKGIRYIHVN